MNYPELKINDSGDAVKILQAKLKILDFYNDVITGNFGLATARGVMALQESYDLNVNGVVDEETWNLLFSLTEKVAPISNYPVLKLGSKGSYVLELQQKLKALLYFTATEDGIFGIETENAVKRLQVLNEITADGIVGSVTWNLINSLYGNLSDCSENVDYLTYTVKKGDTLYGIAKTYGVSVEQIKSLNNLTSDILKIGDVLKIPAKNVETTSYIVKKGDTLYGIAKAYNITVDELINYNNLQSTVLQIGQVLNIPTMSGSPLYKDYIVQKGDKIFMGNNE